MDYTKFYENLEKLISVRGMTPHGFAVDCKISPATISRYINRVRTPDIEHAFKIANYFGVTVDWLMGIGQDQVQGLSEADKSLIESYNLASETDRLVVDTVLKKYKK